MGLRTYDYIVTLKSAKNYKAFDLITQLLLLIAVAMIGQHLLNTAAKNSTTFITIVLLAGIIITGTYSKITGNSYRFALMWSAMCFFIVLNSWMGIAFLVLAILERQVKFKQEIGFDEEGLTLNSFPKKTYKWHEVNNVILKDGIITIDLYNNKIIQKELEDEADGLEGEFNDFCRSHLLSV